MTVTTEKAKKKLPKQTYTRAEVEELLRKQLQRCADGIYGNMSEYCIKNTIINKTPIIDF